jgi:hypothetical protein
MVPPVRLTLLVVDVRLPPQLVVGAVAVLTVALPGSEFATATPVSAIAFELFNDRVNVEVPFCTTLAGAKDALTVAGFGAVTVRAAVDAVALPPAGPVVSAPAATVLVNAPAVVLETLSVSVQLDFGGMSPPVSVTVPDATVRL